jgi:hypothetical protein
MTVSVEEVRTVALEDAFVRELDELHGTIGELPTATREALRSVLDALLAEGLEPLQRCAALRALDALASAYPRVSPRRGPESGRHARRSRDRRRQTPAPDHGPVHPDDQPGAGRGRRSRPLHGLRVCRSGISAGWRGLQ